jgi:hypothetical protein
VTDTDFLQKLQRPFDDMDIEWRAQRSGMSKAGRPYAILLAYVTNRAIQERLDQTFGISGWKNEYARAPEGGVMCGISIKLDDEWITKWDGAENTDIEAVKGGLSNSMKRAAVQWGIGRYLYSLDATIVSPTEEKGSDTDILVKIKKDKNDKYGDPYYCKRPTLPAWALPDDDSKSTPAPEQLEEIRVLSAQAGKPANLTEVKIKTLLTYRQAEDYLKELRKRSSKEG